MLDDVEKFLLRKIGCTTLCYERFGIHSINGTFLFKDCISHVLLEARGGMLTLKGLRGTEDSFNCTVASLLLL